MMQSINFGVPPSNILDCDFGDKLILNTILQSRMAQQQPPQQNPVAVGIDLGSFQSVIAVTRRTGVEVITNEANFRETPNVVGFGECERYLG